MGRRWLALTIGCVAALASNVALPMTEDMSRCLLARFENADGGSTVDELKVACEQEISAAENRRGAISGNQRQSAVDIRRQAALDARGRRFVISTHRPNYFLGTYNSDPNEAPFQSFDTPEGFLDKEEFKFQVSFKMPIATELFGGDTDLLFAYTGVAWWQFFNDEIDNPFRETNYEPEMILRGFPRAEILGLNFISWELGVNHQSNGQSGPLSRGWDRFIGSTSIEFSDDLVLGLRAWHILNDQRTNSDIHRYMGYGDIGVGWVPNRHTFSLMYRPATEGDAVQLSWSYPITKYMRVYAQYWNGYAESLIDHNVRTKRFGVGFALSDVLARD